MSKHTEIPALSLVPSYKVFAFSERGRVRRTWWIKNGLQPVYACVLVHFTDEYGDQSTKSFGIS